MASVTISKTFTRKVETEVSATQAHIRGITLAIDDSLAVIEVVFKDGESVYGQELWIVKGQALQQALNRAPAGGTGLAVIIDQVEFIVNAVENTPGKKQELIDNGQLTVSSGSILAGIMAA